MTYLFGKLLMGFLLHKKRGHFPLASCNKILTSPNIFYRSFELCPLLIIILNLRLILKIKTLFLKIISCAWLTAISKKFTKLSYCSPAVLSVARRMRTQWPLENRNPLSCCQCQSAIHYQAFCFLSSESGVAPAISAQWLNSTWQTKAYFFSVKAH